MFKIKKVENKIVSCPDCNKKRSVTYSQNWNISKGISSGRCHKCRKNRSLTGLLKGMGWNKGLKGYSKGHKPFFIAFGENNPSWKGGITPVNTKIRNSKEYSTWRKNIFTRDDFTCQLCQKRGVKLNADHIKPFALFPELRLDINNGRTLCVACHRKTETFGGRALKFYGI